MIVWMYINTQTHTYAIYLVAVGAKDFRYAAPEEVCVSCVCVCVCVGVYVNVSVLIYVRVGI